MDDGFNPFWVLRMKIDQAPTACDSFHAHSDCGLASGQRAMIVSFIANNGGTWSIGELAEAMEMQKSTVSPRIREAIDSGELVAMKKRKDRVSGVTIRPVGLPPMNGELFL